MEVDPPSVYNREPLEFKSFNKFETSTRNFDHQFSSIYTARLKALRDPLAQKAKIKWADTELVTLSDLSERTEADTCIVIGTLYKHQELKPSILRELSEELQLVAQPARANYASFKDVLYLEDETLRIKLVGDHMDIQDIVTGTVCAVLGHELENGSFSVIDWCFPGCPNHVSTFNQSEIKGKVLIISGLDLANNAELLSLNLLSEWITGMVGSNETQKEIASVLCVIIAGTSRTLIKMRFGISNNNVNTGNSIRGSVETYNHTKYFENKAHGEAMFKETALITHKLDDFLISMVQYCPVILMPGEFDPSCHTLPQQAFHPCILPQCSRFKSFHGVTNPWVGSINSRILVGSSGQPIKDIMKVAGLADVSPLKWLERTLLWRHYAPTAPDTVPAYPYSEIDPFIITECPDIYFAGNMDKYDTGLFTADDGQVVRLICVPKFSDTQTGVLVDLHDLKAVPLSFTVK